MVFKLELSEQMLQVIGNALGAAPYNVAAPVVAELQKQVSAQLQPATPAEKSAEGPIGA